MNETATQEMTLPQTTLPQMATPAVHEGAATGDMPSPIGARQAPTAGQTHVVHTAALPWQDLGPGIRCKVLHRDDVSGGATVLFHFAPGAQAPMHEHMGLEQTYIIEGSLSDHDGTVVAGELAVRDAGSVHQAHTETGSLHIAFFSKPVRNLQGGIAGFFKRPAD